MHNSINYHEYFSRRIQDGSKILDVICEIGMLSLNIAKKLTKNLIIIFDINENNIFIANDLLENLNLSNFRYINGDINHQKYIKVYYVIILNILEHIKNRTKFLKNIQEIINSKIFLIRVLKFEKYCQIAMRNELGIYYFSDVAYKLEHKVDQFKKDLNKTGFIKNKIIKVWGEIWANYKYGS